LTDRRAPIISIFGLQDCLLCKKKKPMKFNSLLIYLMLTIALSSCSPTSTPEPFNAKPEVVLKNFKAWWEYHSQNINLSKNYTALDASSKVINHELFLQMLATGNYVAFRLNTPDLSYQYKLYELSPKADNEIRTQVIQFGEAGYRKFKMEGTRLPDFNFTDLNGNVYNKENTKGKIVVVKCWFVNCQKCVEEMPALNELVKEFSNRPDVVFISLAFDSKEKLKKFLTNTTFDYAVIPVSQNYLEEKLKVTEYPTHFILNRKGRVTKVVTDYHDMIYALKYQLSE